MVKRVAKRRSEKAGLPPGSAVAVSEKVVQPERVWISAIRYHADQIEFREDIPIGECVPPQNPDEVLWINVDGLNVPDTISQIGRQLDLHPLSIEDVLNTTIRPKLEDYGNYLLVILKMLHKAPGSSAAGHECFTTEQVSVLFGKNWVVTFQEHHLGDVFDPVRQRLKLGKGKIRSSGADYLAYSLIDAIVDGYFIVLEELGEEVESLESAVTENPHAIANQQAVTRNGAPLVGRIHAARNFGLFLRRYVWPVRDVIAGMERTESPLIAHSTKLYLRDVYDHSVEIMEMLEAYREMVAGLMELYLSSVSNRMNSVMMVLTTVTTIFMPLSFIAGVYGMNFEHMPELHWEYGYPIILGVMIFIAIAMLGLFRRRGWI